MIGWRSFQSAVSLIGGEPPEATVPRDALVRAAMGKVGAHLGTSMGAKIAQGAQLCA